MLRVGWYRARRTLRRQWGQLATIALLIGLVGGLALGSITGARRTQAAFPTYLETSKASDIQVQLNADAATTSIDARLYDPTLTRRLRHLPRVTRVTASVSMFALPLDAHGKATMPASMADNSVGVVGGVDGEFTSIDRMVPDQGRLADPRRLGEMVATVKAAQLLGWHVGQTFAMGAFTFDQTTTVGSNGIPVSPPYFRFEARLVGIAAVSTDVVHDEVDQALSYVVLTPTLTRHLLSNGAGFTTYQLALQHGTADVPAVEREIVAALPAGTTYNFHLTSVIDGQLERAVKPESIALGVFGLIALLAALLITAQAISRRIRSDVRDLDVLRALGADRVMTVTGSLLGTIGAIFIGAVAAAVVAVALSPIAPIGAVRRIDPAPGFDLDWTVLLGGVASFVVVLSVVSTVLALVVTRPPSRSGPSWKTRRVPGAVRAAVRAGMPPPSVVGIRFAVERNAGRDSVPVSSVLLGAALSVAVVVATLTFASSLNTLVSRPQLYGWNWSYAIAQPGGGNVPPMAENLLSRDPDVAAWSGFNFGNASFDGQTVPILLTRANAPVQPPILSGHAVTGDHEVVLGGATLAQLHKKVGDTVVVTYGTPQDAPIYVPPTRVRIVGTATLPAIGNGATLHPSMGTGAVGAVGIEPPAMQAALLSSDPNLNGPPVIAVRLKSGVAPAAGLASLQRVAAAATRIMAHDPNGGGGFSVLPVQQPAEIVNYRAMGGTPSVLALALAVGAVTALGLLLIASVRRRRRDLALLKTLGFVGRQLAAVVSWQASLIALAGLVIGTPIGIVVGRSLWRLFAGEIYAVPATSVPVSQLLLVAVGALVLANAVATVPARLAAATPAGELLRTE